MALDNFANLRAAVIDWSKRNDVQPRFEDALLLAETEMLSNPVENLIIRDFSTRSQASMSITSRFLALPDNFNSMLKFDRLLEIATGEYTRIPIHFRTRGQMFTTDTAGIPSEFSLGSQIEFNVLPETADLVEMQYRSGFTKLSDANVSNSVLTAEPNVYFFGCLAMVNRYAQNDTEEDRYIRKFYDAIAGANKKTREGQYGPRARIIPRGRKP